MSEEKKEKDPTKRQRENQKSDVSVVPPPKKAKTTPLSIFSIPPDILINGFRLTDRSLSSLSQTCKHFYNNVSPSWWKIKFIEWLAEGELTYDQWKQNYAKNGCTFNEKAVNWREMYRDVQKRTETYARMLYNYLYIQVIEMPENNEVVSTSHFEFSPDSIVDHLWLLKKDIQQLNEDNHGNGLAIIKCLVNLWEFEIKWQKTNGHLIAHPTQKKILDGIDGMNITLMGFYIYLLDIPTVRFLLTKGFSVNNEHITMSSSPEDIEHILMTRLLVEESEENLSQPFLEKILGMLSVLLTHGLDATRFCFIPDSNEILTHLARYAHNFVDLIPQVKNIINLLPNNYFTEKLVCVPSNNHYFALHYLVEVYDTADKTTNEALFCREIFAHLFDTRKPIIAFFSSFSKNVCANVEEFMQDIRKHRVLKTLGAKPEKTELVLQI